MRQTLLIDDDDAVLTKEQFDMEYRAAIITTARLGKVFTRNEVKYRPSGIVPEPNWYGCMWTSLQAEGVIRRHGRCAETSDDPDANSGKCWRWIICDDVVFDQNGIPAAIGKPDRQKRLFDRN